MGKLQDWSITTCLFLFFLHASQIHCTCQSHVRNRLYRSKRGIGSSIDTSHLNAIRRLSVSLSLQNISGVNQQEQKERDLIENLPGQPSVNFKQYGGYVTVNESAGRSLYYYFVEATITKNSSPLVLWLNGGPGCSSLYGAFQELGPFRVHSDNKTLYTNPYSWNNVANMLFLESPAGTGFSYTNTTTDMENPGDMKTAADNYVFLVKWLERFPEYKGRDFYIAGESYAGHYVPQLAQTILVHNKNQTFINLRGILIGNPSLGKDDMGGYEFLASRGFVPEETFLRYKKSCGHDNPPDVATFCMDTSLNFEDILENMNKYNILAHKCLNATLTNQSKECTTVMQSDPCGERYVEAYFNWDEVQRSMHVTKMPYTWTICSEALGYSYWNQTDYSASMLPILKELMKHDQLRVWVFSGDTDAVISVTVTMYALKMMNLTAVTEWLPWFSEGQVGGFTEEYRGNFRFATVRGAGHEVPLYKPKAALTLFKHFILNSPLPLTP
ncbi:Peptidase S10 serine carboxypeptidase [Arabidopsis thaliana x Arabidopsis arenosa]|nr:Peptidase S10 serine carboxypeptidase [Arabidopsis thaliana x Arabidopsis arenosa]